MIEDDDDVSYEDARLLWVHVMRKAVEDFKSGSKSRGAESKKAYEDAKRWIWSDSEEFPSFIFLCEILELNARQIRREMSGYELSQRRQREGCCPDVLEQGRGGEGSEGEN